MRTALEIRIAGIKAAIEHVREQIAESEDRVSKAFLEGLLAGYENHLNSLNDILEIVKVEEENKYEVI